MPPHVSIDLERATAKGLQAPAAPGPALPLLRRRKGLVFIILFSLILLGIVNRNHISDATASFRWVKDSMRPVHVPTATDPLPNDFGAGVLQAVTGGQISGQEAAEAHRPGTDAFRKLAESQGYTPEQIDKLALAQGSNSPSQATQSKPTADEHILLFLQAMANPSYQVPSSAWKKQLMPSTYDGFAKSLAAVETTGGLEDVELFRTNRPRWNALHRAQHPLVVFSKSYCPYSKRAKALLTSLGAKFQVIEVDERPHDAGSLQAALAAVSGHHTFPAVFAGGKLLGGSDDLQTLKDLNVLSGVLKASGAL